VSAKEHMKRMSEFVLIINGVRCETCKNWSRNLEFDVESGKCNIISIDGISLTTNKQFYCSLYEDEYNEQL